MRTTLRTTRRTDRISTVAEAPGGTTASVDGDRPMGDRRAGDRPSGDRPGGDGPNDHRPSGHGDQPSGAGRAGGDGEDADDLDAALLEVRSLLDDILSRHRDLRSSQGSITPLAPDDGVLADRVDLLCGDAEHCLDAVIAPERESGRLIGEALHEILSRPEGAPRVRVLTTLAGPPHGWAHPPSWRVAAVPPMQLLLVDRVTALIQVESALGPRAAQVRDPTLVGTLLSLFDGLWHRSAPSASPDFDVRGGSRLARAVLRAMSEGITDEAAARELGMSVRTYRRHVAEIMATLGARSRFQAGALAAELGLLAPRSSR